MTWSSERVVKEILKEQTEEYYELSGVDLLEELGYNWEVY